MRLLEGCVNNFTRIKKAVVLKQNTETHIYMILLGFNITVLFIHTFFLVSYNNGNIVLYGGSFMDYHGLDVSQWQGNIDFQKVKEDGFSIVYIKAGEGSDSVDPFFERNYENAFKEGLKIGFYYYVTARSASQAKQQARHFVSITSNKSYDCRLAMDFEDLTGLSRHQVNGIGTAFIDALGELTETEPMVYSDRSNTSVFSVPITSYPLWLAYYDENPPTSLNNWSSFIGWQYTDAGRIDGIQTSVDLNWFYDDVLLPNSHIHGTPDQNYYPFLETTVRYRVRKGDTLGKIARLYHTTVTELVKVNHIENQNLIYINQILKIPVDDEQKDSDIYILYTIRPGDTLFSIANQYDTTIAELTKLNHINSPDLIYPGQRLKILRSVY